MFQQVEYFGRLAPLPGTRDVVLAFDCLLPDSGLLRLALDGCNVGLP